MMEWRQFGTEILYLFTPPLFTTLFYSYQKQETVHFWSTPNATCRTAYGGTIYCFALCKSHKEVFVTFAYNGDVHWAERLDGLSTEWLIAAHPEDK